MTTVNVFAPAKINLTLHVTGQRDDGYHLLDSLVTFASAGDRLEIVTGNALSLTVEGPEAAGVPTDMNNLALRAAAMFQQDGAALRLEKYLPPASGIGGGSADAAAAWRGMVCLDEARKGALASAPLDILEQHLDELASLGADVPMCLACKPMRARGIGDRLDVVPLPTLYAVLVNPRLPVSTPSVFTALTSKTNPPMPDEIPAFADAAALIDWLGEMRNDLEPPAVAVQPAIADVLGVLAAQDGCGLARMSGSGATCFGLFETEAKAKEATGALYHAHPEWWVVGCVLGDQFNAALPKVS
ncbi:4-(cytidine 5'-diphospho)-2-C-methyl-D-erythritol kinase [Marivita sp.]|jgi:4-diphosphocytidyl-2-C-methyl-D-erythritol kinase|uniref:4-(cytidine 5'-diphospho)-2-C-methyl-D-erythritol kinase n=1 Tax=Marivita sp. TaxID=2003365 RepID=UPI003F6B027C